MSVVPDSPMHVASSPRSGFAVGNDLFGQVNDWRRSQGAGPLQRHRGMDELARQHSEYLRDHRGEFDRRWKKLSHANFDHRASAMQRTFRMYMCGENVVTAYDSGGNQARQLLDRWIDSRAHAKNMRSKSWTVTGIGVVVDQDGAMFATQLFATENSTTRR